MVRVFLTKTSMSELGASKYFEETKAQHVSFLAESNLLYPYRYLVFMAGLPFVR